MGGECRYPSQANDDTDHRGLGVYMQNVPGQREWFMGNPHNEPDMWMLARVATEQSTMMMQQKFGTP